MQYFNASLVIKNWNDSKRVNLWYNWHKLIKSLMITYIVVILRSLYIRLNGGAVST